MKKIIKTQHQIDAPIDKLWANISKASGVNTWLPVITSCSLEGQGEGAKRICSSEQGDLLEKIVKIDHERKIFQYAIEQQPFFPITNILGTMTVSESMGKSQLNWDLAFDLTDESAFPMIKEAIEGMYSTGAMGLETISNN